MTDWLLHLEQWNVPHFMRGALLGLAFWVIGLKWVQPKIGFSAITFSLLTMLFFSIGWEVRDQIYSLAGRSDPFDFVDIIFDMAGAGFVQLVHWSTHRWDRR